MREKGLRLAAKTGANTNLVELFAFLHDLKRENDGWDESHGERAAAFLIDNLHLLPPVSDSEFELLLFAIRHHSSGRTKGDITAQTCWDADRLDLGRIGIMPDPKYLCTDAAKKEKIIKWAYRRSRSDHKRK